MESHGVSAATQPALVFFKLHQIVQLMDVLNASLRHQHQQQLCSGAGIGHSIMTMGVFDVEQGGPVVERTAAVGGLGKQCGRNQGEIDPGVLQSHPKV